jgi:glycosyltransferase involved in cell wall biosynthesis
MPSTVEQVALKVSVIIPTYNRAGYLREALDSVFNQSLLPWEVIVVDDGSTDDTRQVIQNASMPVRYFEQAHCGVASARNLGLENATGDLVAWLDSDDLWEVDFLETVVSFLAQDETLDGVYTGITMIDAEGVQLGSLTRIEPPDMLYEALIRSSFLATPTVVVKKVCYDRVGGFDPQLHIAEDYDMWLRLTGEFRLAGIPRPLARIRVHATNTMSNIDVQCQARLTLLHKHFGVSQTNENALPEKSRTAYGYAYRAIATQYIESGQPDRGWSYLMKAATLHPPILEELDTFYELALGDQPRGYRGDVTRLDITANGIEMLHRLDVLFDSAGVDIQVLRGTAYGNAHLALAMLSDQAGQWGAARRNMLRAMRACPRLLCQSSTMRRLTKLFIGKSMVSWLRRLTLRAPKKPFTKSDV